MLKRYSQALWVIAALLYVSSPLRLRRMRAFLFHQVWDGHGKPL